ncbi:hypothetical protein LOK49_LG06G01680 [Camellia lanceoleosa]|uniref:Uncharacterized protein n=1 Tax=Camellia lanceoleosa TaxID=1840588 RepID=A0ACC0HDW3_9ERIC|nr:hypothetical protein LOK49_LG06G01680 [Camellia lanceoleosa]
MPTYKVVLLMQMVGPLMPVVFLDTRTLPSLLITRQQISTPFLEEEDLARRMPLLEEWLEVEEVFCL